MIHYTKYHSLADILSYPRMAEYLHIFFSEELLGMFPKELYVEPIAMVEHFAKTPWGEPFPIVADQLVDTANLILEIYEEKTRRCVSLWDTKDGDWSLEKEAKGSKDSVFLLSPEKREVNYGKPRPMAIICPGGGYEAVCFSGEGTPILRLLEIKGYCVFILKYRVAPNRYPAPQEDLALAIQYVRAHAEEYGGNPDDLLLIGASAGAHLCASEAALYKEAALSADKQLARYAAGLAETYSHYSARPDKLCLSYPVINLESEAHEGSFQALTGGEDSLRHRLSAENLVTEGYPPTFVWTCADDDCVPPSNTRRMAEALKRNHVPHRFRMYPEGSHGCGLAYSKSAYMWSKDMLEFMTMSFHCAEN